MNSEADRTLPIANVGRIMKQILPPSAKISKESKQVMQECVTEFVSFVTGEASDKCHKENRKTVNGDDICWALSSLGFDNYDEAIQRYLYKFRQAQMLQINKNKLDCAMDKDKGAAAAAAATNPSSKNEQIKQSQTLVLLDCRVSHEKVEKANPPSN